MAESGPFHHHRRSTCRTSRPRLEAHLRARLSALPTVRIHDRRDVDALAAEGGRVTGVTAGEEAISADLVVDATGRGSQSPAGLEKLGFQRPREDAVRVGRGYTTRVYQRKPDHLVARAFHRVANLLDPPPSLMQPGMAFRILQGNMRKPHTRH